MDVMDVMDVMDFPSSMTAPAPAGALHPVHENPELAIIAGMAFPPRPTENAITRIHKILAET